MYNELFVTIIAENDKIMIDDWMSDAIDLLKFIEDYLFSKHNMNKKTNSNDNDSWQTIQLFFFIFIVKIYRR